MDLSYHRNISSSPYIYQFSAWTQGSNSNSLISETLRRISAEVELEQLKDTRGLRTGDVPVIIDIHKPQEKGKSYEELGYMLGSWGPRRKLIQSKQH